MIRIVVATDEELESQQEPGVVSTATSLWRSQASLTNALGLWTKESR